ncbi:protein NO VEIN domain-containing protein [Nocardioides sp. YJ-D4]
MSLINAEKVRNPTKLELAQAIADKLGIARPVQSKGSSVDSTFLDRIHTALTGDESTMTDAYRKAERALQDLGLTYDPFWDTSESSATGGSTVTNRAYSRILAAVTRVPRCFLVDCGPMPLLDDSYRYDKSAGGHGSLNDAGPGSRVIFYRREDAGLRFEAHGEVAYIASGWSGPWSVEFVDLARFTGQGVLLEDLGWAGRLSSVTEITYATYHQLLIVTGHSRLADAAEKQTDPGGDVVAQRIASDESFSAMDVRIDVPEPLPTCTVEVCPATLPVYTEGDGTGAVSTDDLPPTPRDRKKAKAAEERAIKLTVRALEAAGWALRRDRQKDGAGYDLLFVSGERELHVEVKGIMSTVLAFNLTPKESWRVETDERFVVVAVTNVLSPAAFKLHLLTRVRLASAARVITGYRLKL